MKRVLPTHIDAPGAQAAQFESETLWAVVAPSASGDHVLIVRGADGGDTTAPAQAQAALGWRNSCKTKAHTPFLPPGVRTPRPRPPPLDMPSCSAGNSNRPGGRLAAANALGIWPMLAPQLSWQAHTALATHPRIAQQAQALGFGQVRTVRHAGRCSSLYQSQSMKY